MAVAQPRNVDQRETVAGAGEGDCPDFCVSKNGTVPFAATGGAEAACAGELRAAGSSVASSNATSVVASESGCRSGVPPLSSSGRIPLLRLSGRLLGIAAGDRSVAGATLAATAAVAATRFAGSTRHAIGNSARSTRAAFHVTEQASGQRRCKRKSNTSAAARTAVAFSSNSPPTPAADAKPVSYTRVRNVMTGLPWRVARDILLEHGHLFELSTQLVGLIMLL